MKGFNFKVDDIVAVWTKVIGLNVPIGYGDSQIFTTFQKDSNGIAISDACLRDYFAGIDTTTSEYVAKNVIMGLTPAELTEHEARLR